MIKKSFIILLFVLIAFNIYGDNSASGLFLNIPYNAELMGIANSSVGAAKGLVSIDNNVAGISSVENGEAFISYNKWLFDTSSLFFSAGYSLRNIGVVGFSVRTLSLPVLENKYYTTVQYENSDIAIGFSYAKNLKKVLNIPFSVGISAKYISEKLANISATTFLIDVGFLYYITDSIGIGIAVKNIGSGIDFDDYGNNSPVYIDSGVSYKYIFKKAAIEHLLTTLNFKYSLYADLSPGFGEEIYFSSFNNITPVLRLGLQYRDGMSFSEMMTFGAGLKWINIIFDYSFSNIVSEVGYTHILSIKYRF